MSIHDHVLLIATPNNLDEAFGNPNWKRQQDLLLNLMRFFNLPHYVTGITPMTTTKKLLAYAGTPLSGDDVTRPDILFFLHAPTTDHWTAIGQDALMTDGPQVVLLFTLEGTWSHGAMANATAEIIWIQERVVEKKLHIKFISTGDQIADGLTKQLMHVCASHI
ncbi:hypothetical protein ACJX0J_033894, partial [Zea mays]